MGQDIRHVSRIPQVPDDAPRLGLAVGDHATGQIAGLCRWSIDQSTVAKDFCGCFQLPGDGGKARHQCIVALARNSVSLFNDDADPSLDQWYALLENLYGQSSREHQYREVEIPGLIEVAFLFHWYRGHLRVPCLSAMTRLHFKAIFARRKTAIASEACVGCGPLGIIAGEPVAELNLRRVGKMDCVEEKGHI